MLAVSWSTASHYIIGIPFDLISRASRYGGQDEEDLRDLIRINARRLTYISETAGSWLVAVSAFLLTGFLVLGFWYRLEICQALFLIFAPMSLVFALSIGTARKLLEDDRETTYKRLKRHRLVIQIIGMISILITAMWGMYFNLSVGVLGS